MFCSLCIFVFYLHDFVLCAVCVSIVIRFVLFVLSGKSVDLHMVPDGNSSLKCWLLFTGDLTPRNTITFMQENVSKPRSRTKLKDNYE